VNDLRCDSKTFLGDSVGSTDLQRNSWLWGFYCAIMRSIFVGFALDWAHL